MTDAKCEEALKRAVKREGEHLQEIDKLNRHIAFLIMDSDGFMGHGRDEEKTKEERVCSFEPWHGKRV